MRSLRPLSHLSAEHKSTASPVSLAQRKQGNSCQATSGDPRKFTVPSQEIVRDKISCKLVKCRFYSQIFVTKLNDQDICLVSEL